MNVKFDARIRELEVDVRKGQGDYESRLLTILLAANSSGLLVTFNAALAGSLEGRCPFLVMVFLFALGAGAALLALVRAYLTGRELSQLLAEAVMVGVNRSETPTAEEQLAESLQHDEFITKVDAINERGKPFTWLLSASGGLFVVGIAAGALVLVGP